MSPLAESLKIGTGLDGHGMRLVRCARYEVTGAADYQPAVWTNSTGPTDCAT